MWGRSTDCRIIIILLLLLFRMIDDDEDDEMVRSCSGMGNDVFRYSVVPPVSVSARVSARVSWCHGVIVSLCQTVCELVAWVVGRII